jgi:uncharacterized protein YjiS (DUF1127 family)
MLTVGKSRHAQDYRTCSSLLHEHFHDLFLTVYVRIERGRESCSPVVSLRTDSNPPNRRGVKPYKIIWPLTMWRNIAHWHQNAKKHRTLAPKYEETPHSGTNVKKHRTVEQMWRNIAHWHKCEETSHSGTNVKKYHTVAQIWRNTTQWHKCEEIPHSGTNVKKYRTVAQMWRNIAHWHKCRKTSHTSTSVKKT